jgi:hypothetical protein
MKAHDGIRTRDLFLTKEVLYRLSYMGIVPAAPSIIFYQLSANSQRTDWPPKWSGRRDSNPRPRAWKARALPTELLPHSAGHAKIGGEGRIRTSEGISRQIYSLLPLATREPLQANLPIGPSRWRESNSQPTDYKSVALPLSYIGAEFLCIKTSALFCRIAQVNKRGE